MAKVNKEYQARMDGMLFAFKIAKEKGLDELEKDIRMRNILKLDLWARKDEVEEFNDLTEQGKQEVDILEANAEIQKIIKGYEETNGWIPVDEGTPIDDRYILLSFENFSTTIVGRYEEDEDGSGNFYAGDEDIPLVKQDMIVNAWRELPERYTSE